MQAVAFSQALAAVLDDTGVTFSDVVFVNATDTGSSKSTLQRRRLMQVGLRSHVLQHQGSCTDHVQQISRPAIGARRIGGSIRV